MLVRHVLPKAFGMLLFLVLPFGLYAQSPTLTAPAPVAEDTSRVYTSVEKMPEFPGGVDALYTYLNSNFKYPAALQHDSTTTTVIYSFIVSPTGKAHDVSKVKGVHPAVDAEFARVLQNMPLWVPGEQNGKTRRVKYTLPYKVAGTPLPTTAATEEEKIYIATEVAPTFPGGRKAMTNYLKKHFRPSVQFADKGMEGSIVLSVILNKDGSIKPDGTKILKGLGYGMDEKMIEVVNGLPSFTPAQQNGQPVLYKTVLPIKLDANGYVKEVLEASQK